MLRLPGALWLFLLFLPADAGAHEAHYVESRGAVWRHQENRNGAVLRRDRTVVYLGRSCDVVSRQLGKGRWGWANGGVIVTAGSHRLVFPRHDPPIRDPRCDVGGL